MFDAVLTISSWITAALLVALSWFVYKYSRNLVVDVNYWRFIYKGIIFFAASEIARPLYVFGDIFFIIYLIFSMFGALLLAYGFHRLYEMEKV